MLFNIYFPLVLLIDYIRFSYTIYTSEGGINLDYYCFPTKTGDVSIFFDLEQYTNPRERNFYQMAQENVMLAQQKGKLLLFDLRTQTFIDNNGDTIDIKGKEIFPRCKIQDSEQLLNAIESHGGNSIVTRADSEIVENWFEYIGVGREILKTTFGELQDNLSFYEEKYGTSFFVKTVKKGFAGICSVLQTGESKALFSFVGRSLLGGNMIISDNSTPVLVTNALSILRDDYGKREWRVFVVRDRIWSISRVSDDLVPIEPLITQKVQCIMNQISYISSFPSSYCIDFFEYERDGKVIFDICELNPIESSGVYRNNDLVI